MSLLNRVNASQSQQNQGSPFRRASTNSPFGSRRSAFGNRSQAQNQQLLNVVIPAEQTLVRFSLDGMGDPFYRLLGRQMTPEYSDVRTLAEALQRGGDSAKDLTAVLDKAWANYDLTGAMLVFNNDTDVMNALLKPTPMPTPPQDESQDDEDDSDEDKQFLPQPHPDYHLERLRAIDLTLTLNVLTRARSQVLVAGAPVVFGMEYLTRSLITDDPRLVSLAKATGCLPDH